jgi:BirA family biotin operon repressor/biotin-[acetyl-CoA-carboxylase] ligase
VIIGFGVNLAACPGAVDRATTSLAALAGSAPEPAAFLDILAASFERWLSRWRSEGVGAIRRQWLAVAHPPGTALSVGERGERVQGLFEGLDEHGALRLRRADGTIHVVHAGDVFLI